MTESPTSLAGLLKLCEAGGQADTPSAEHAAALCAEVGDLRRLVSAGQEDGTGWTPGPPMLSQLESAERVLRSRPRLVEQALEATARAPIDRQLEQYVLDHPEGDEDDEGLALLFDLDRAMLVAAVAARSRRGRGARVRARLARVDRQVVRAARLVSLSPWTFARWRDVIASYGEDHRLGLDHPFMRVLQRSSGEIDALLELDADRRQAVATRRAAEAWQARAERARARGRPAEALRGLIAALRESPGRSPAIRALRELLAAVGRPFEFAAPTTVAQAGVLASPAGAMAIALRYGDATTRITVIERLHGELVAIVEERGEPVEGAEVALVDVTDRTSPSELAAGVTGADGEAKLGAAQRFAALLDAAARQRIKVKVVLPPEPEEGADDGA